MQNISICRTVKQKDYRYSDQAARYIMPGENRMTKEGISRTNGPEPQRQLKRGNVQQCLKRLQWAYVRKERRTGKLGIFPFSWVNYVPDAFRIICELRIRGMEMELSEQGRILLISMQKIPTAKRRRPLSPLMSTSLAE